MEPEFEDSTCIGKEPCPKCGSSDNLARYDDGHAHCFGMGCDYYEKGDNATITDTPAKAKKKPRGMIDEWESVPLKKRGLSLKTTEKWRYGIAEFNGQKVQVANYVRDGQVIGQKVRFANKDFLTLGNFKQAGLFGQHLWREGGRKLVITEGEIDAMSVSQLFGLKWPVVSVPNGAQGAAKSLKKELEWVLTFDEVIFMFDNDEAGQAATLECVALFPPGTCKVAAFELKDANAMLVEGRGAEVVQAFWDAKVYRPDGIIGIGDIKQAALKPVVMGTPWPWAGLTKATRGRRDGELYGVGAGTGMGKTDVFTQIIEFDAIKQKTKCGVIYLEQHPVETVHRIAGKLAGKKFHLPNKDVDPEDGEDWTMAELESALDTLEATDTIELYNHFGSMDWETIEGKIRYMVVALGCKNIFLDHLTAMAAHAEDERKALEGILADMASLAQELQFKFHYISHLATPEGKPHEEGGRVMLRHFKGSRAIGFWTHFAIGLERDQQAEDMAVRTTTTLRVLKDRYTGSATGYTMGLCYDMDTGILNECDIPKPQEKGKASPADSLQQDF